MSSFPRRGNVKTPELGASPEAYILARGEITIPYSIYCAAARARRGKCGGAARGGGAAAAA
eukprot:4133075-Pleurochrysis_carterae.AAC.1